MSLSAQREGTAATATLFPSFFLGGFEASTHVLRSGRRLDLVGSTRHDVFAEADYRRLVNLGMRAARGGLRWHVLEYEPGQYDFSTARSMVRAALASGIEVVWDLLHFGWPDHVDPFDADFVPRFAEFAARFAMVLESENAIEKLRKVMGATDPAKAENGTIRKQFGTNIERNAIHGSDGAETAAFEIAYFFNQLEIV